MKPTASALQKFLLGATVAVSSSWEALAQQIPHASSTTKHSSDDLGSKEPPIDERLPESHHHHTALWYSQQRESVGGEASLGIHNHHHKIQPQKNQRHHNVNRNGVLTSSQSSTEEEDASPTGSPCHPDLGVLACAKGYACQKALDEEDEEEDFTEDIVRWHCVKANKDSTVRKRHETKEKVMETARIQRSFRRDVMQQQRRNLRNRYQDQQEQHRDLSDELNAFPPTGKYYDQCTYDEGYKYDYNSTIRYPSAWDVCVCKKYNYDLPESSKIYTDVDYCFKVKKYYCSNYFDEELDPGHPTEFDACLCAKYGVDPIPDEPADFCTELPVRYCDGYYPNGDLVGQAKCLCDNFGYSEFCNFVPPDDFVPVARPTSTGPTPSPTTPSPTVRPTPRPTEPPTPKPSPKPTREPTPRPTGTPSKPPTPRPTGQPTFPPTNQPTLRPTPQPTREPSPPTPPPTPSPVPKPPPNNPPPKRNPPKNNPPAPKPTTPFPTRFFGIFDNNGNQVVPGAPIPQPKPPMTPQPVPQRVIPGFPDGTTTGSGNGGGNNNQNNKNKLPNNCVETRDGTSDQACQALNLGSHSYKCEAGEGYVCCVNKKGKKFQTGTVAGQCQRNDQTPLPTARPTVPPTQKPSPFPTVPPTQKPTVPPTQKPSPNPTSKPTSKPSPNAEEDPPRAGNLPKGTGQSLPPPDAADGSKIHNVHNLPGVISKLQRQPNLSQRPGSALRLHQTHNIFERGRIL